MGEVMEIIVIEWEWTEGSHKGARFWAAHAAPDGRVRDWPEWGLKPLAAASVTVTEGEGLHLLKQIAAQGPARATLAQPAADGHRSDEMPELKPFKLKGES